MGANMSILPRTEINAIRDKRERYMALSRTARTAACMDGGI